MIFRVGRAQAPLFPVRLHNLRVRYYILHTLKFLRNILRKPEKVYLVTCSNNGTLWDCPNHPSHCTMGKKGNTEIIPVHSTVAWERFDRTGLILKCPICCTLSYLSIPSHCTEMVRLELYQGVQFAQFHCTMGRNGWTRIVPKCPIFCTLVLPVHPSVHIHFLPCPRMDSRDRVYSKWDTVVRSQSVHSLLWYCEMGWTVETGHKNGTLR